MIKQEAIDKFGTETVEKARELYETDMGKVLFEEDATEEGDQPLNAEERMEYLWRAHAIMLVNEHFDSVEQAMVYIAKELLID